MHLIPAWFSHSPVSFHSSFPGPFILFSFLFLLNALLPISFPPSCHAARKGSENQRVDTPSLEDTSYLMLGLEYDFTNLTSVAASKNAREYVDGMLATQRIIAAPIIPIDRQSWTGIDTTRSYFGRGRNGSTSNNDSVDYGKERIKAIPNVLRAGMRKLVLDLWWDPVALGWQICPRMNRDASTLQALSIRLQQHLDGENFPKSAHMMGKHAAVGASRQDSSKEDQNGAHDGDPSQQPGSMHGHLLSDTADFIGAEKHRGKREPRSSHFTPLQSQLPLPTLKYSQRDESESLARSAAPEDPIISTSSSAAQEQSTRSRLHNPVRLAMSKSRTSAYDSSLIMDRTVDGITCSTGEDLTITLQALQSWLEQTSDDELVDILLVIINLNELNTTSIRSNVSALKPTMSQPSPILTPSPELVFSGASENSDTAIETNVTGTLLPELSRIISPNTNSTIMAVMPNVISLRQIFEDAFPSMIYTPIQLQLDRNNLNSTWWKDGPVGLDYYNTTIDPTTNLRKTSTGWPTTKYLTDVLKTRIIVGFGNVNLNPNSNYNMTDDLELIFAPGVLDGTLQSDRGLSVSVDKNITGILQYSSSLDSNHCERPLPDVLMQPTGAEGNWTELAMNERDTNIRHYLRWGFANIADGSDLLWTSNGVKTATVCGYSVLDQGGGGGLTISDLVASTGWSWDLDQPPLSEITSRNRRCAVMQINGRWAVQNCNLKLPAACRKNGTSGQWIIHKAGAANYRDVVCPSGYKFDVPRTARENQELYKALLQHWNDTAPAFFSAVVRQQNLQQWWQQEMPKAKPVGVLELFSSSHDSTLTTTAVASTTTFNSSANEIALKREDGGSRDNRDRKRHSSTRDTESSQDQLLALASSGSLLSNGTMGMIWIDISSWQTAGCWVPGGTDGLCPFEAPDHTAAMQEIIKVSTIGGVIMLILAGAFLYIKCRRNIRLRKANRRRSAVRTKILRTEVETVPA